MDNELGQLDVRSQGEVIHLTGVLDNVTVPSVTQLVLDLVSRAGAETTAKLDLTEVSFLDSTGLRLLVTAMNGAPNGLEIVAASRPAKRVIEITGLADHLGLRSERPAASAS